MTYSTVPFCAGQSSLAEHLNMEPLYQVLTALPFYAIVVFCCYSLGVIGWGLVTFPERNDAEKDLQKDIARAREGLAKKGVPLE